MAKLYTGTATAKGGRNGHVETDDGLLKFDLSVPKGMGGPGTSGTTNPEQLFASGYAACYGGAFDLVASQQKLDSTGTEITCAVSFNKDDSGFFLSAKLRVKAPALDRATAQAVADAAHQVCPYSKATRNNVQVEIEIA